MAIDLRVPMVSSIHPISAAPSGFEVVAPVKCTTPTSCNFNRTHNRGNPLALKVVDPLDLPEFIEFNNLYGLTKNGTARLPAGSPPLKTAAPGPAQRIWPVILDIKGTKLGAPGDVRESTVVNGTSRVNRSCANIDARCESKEVCFVRCAFGKIASFCVFFCDDFVSCFCVF